VEWTRRPEEAFAIAVRLNDRYELDGRDPNGYTGIAWAIGGKHDRAWGPERPIFGTVRFMSFASTSRKFDMRKYLATVAAIGLEALAFNIIIGASYGLRMIFVPREGKKVQVYGATLAATSVTVFLIQTPPTRWGVAVCDGEAYFQQKVRSDLREWQQRYDIPLDVEQLPIRVIDGYVGPGYAQANADVFETIKRVARSEGLVLDPVYTGKAFHALICELQRGRFGDEGDIVFIHTGGTFGLFPQRDKFRF